ncbi:MAG: 50S ribosomal protein L23 [Proteobacteria bacterium]|nr:50S ribosomal protein L23 [Pseudomonadota bacterium]
MQVYDVIRTPMFTDKSSFHRDFGQTYFFYVHLKASKQDIRKAVEELWDVKVEAVNTSVLRGKKKRRGLNVTQLPKRKKAMVTLREGDVIDVFEL